MQQQQHAKRVRCDHVMSEGSFCFRVFDTPSSSSYVIDQRRRLNTFRSSEFGKAAASVSYYFSNCQHTAALPALLILARAEPSKESRKQRDAESV